MGNDQSTGNDDIYEGSPQRSRTLEARDLRSVAKYMKSDECKNVFVMLGAGVSTSAGIPDFRSPETGLYANLARLNLDRPEDVFDIRFFRSNPYPFYALAKELYPGKHRPTITHSFVRLLEKKGLLGTCFTQNIDTLERQAGVSKEKLVEAHGSFASQSCIDCKAPFDGAQIRRLIQEEKIPRCSRCKGLVKPNIVFFGEALPDSFHKKLGDLAEADLLFVIGTSLQVQPFASLTYFVPRSCPRVLINMEEAGDLGTRHDDVLLLGKCDDVVKELAKELEWLKELKAAWAETRTSLDDPPPPDEDSEEEAEDKAPEVEETAEEKLQREIAWLTESVDATLKVTDDLKKRVEKEAKEDVAKAVSPAGSAEGEGENTENLVK